MIFILNVRKIFSIDSNEAAKYYKLSADQVRLDDQFNYGFCLEFGKDFSIDLNKATKYYQPSADQVHADGQCNYEFCVESDTVFRLI
jgi:TPR repeat protein